jgi:pyruvate-formate lyase-activating enzyme
MKKAVDPNQNYDTSDLYRVPWTLTDNGSTWLEITRACDISCEYCLQGHCQEQGKPLAVVAHEIKELVRMRKCDSMIIAGGEPLTHPDIVEIVRLTKAAGVKPFIITNGQALDEPLLRQLKGAGLKGCIIHVDAGQRRPGWTGKNEIELNALRQEFADLFYQVGGLICSFITTVLPRSLPQVREIVKWMANNSHKVTQNIFIPVRGWHLDDPFDYYVDGKQIKIYQTAYSLPVQYPYMGAADIVKELDQALPQYRFAGFLGGTKVANAPKWLMGFQLFAARTYLGNLGPKTLELLQVLHHFLLGRYVSFFPKWTYSWMKFMLLPLALFDARARRALWKYCKAVIRNPVLLFRSVRVQTLVVMQPLDLLENGEMDMCDGCPNKTYYQGRLVSECRMEEYLQYGKLLQHRPCGSVGAPSNILTKGEHCHGTGREKCAIGQA